MKRNSSIREDTISQPWMNWAERRRREHAAGLSAAGPRALGTEARAWSRSASGSYETVPGALAAISQMQRAEKFKVSKGHPASV